MMKRLFYLWPMAALLTACGQKEAAVTEPPLVRLSTVQVVSDAAHASYPGRTQATLTTNVSFRVSGTLDQVKVKEGDAVREGQVIATMDDRDYQVQLSAIEAEYQQIKADCERVIGLYNDGSTTAQNYDKARYGLEQITAKYQHAKDQLADCVLRAPYNGYVQRVQHESHETVSAGMPIVTMFRSNGLEIVINIPASGYMQADRFGSFAATVDVLPGQSFPLRLISIAQRANANQLYEVRLLLENTSANQETLRRVTPGMTALVDIYFKEDGSAPVEIPAGAVFHKGDDSFVFVYDAEGDGQGTLRQTPVQVAELKRSGMMKVLGGLRAGQQVVESGVHHLSDGQRVRPNATPSKANVGGLL